MTAPIRFWLAASSLCAAVTAFADAPKPLAPLPPPRIDFPGLPPVEQIGGGFSEPTFEKPTPRVVETVVVPVTATPKTEDVPALPDKLPTLLPAPEPAAACATDGPAAGAGSSKRTLHEKCAYTPQGNLRAKKIPPEVAAPNGAVVRGVFDRQKQLALGEYFVVYREDFVAETAELNDTGRRHLAGILKRLDQTDATIKVEPTGSTERDGKRRTAVLDALLEMGADANVSARILGGGTRAEGLRYEDIPAVGRRNPLLGGASGGGFGGGGGGLNGSNFGGGFAGGGGIGGAGFGGFR